MLPLALSSLSNPIVPTAVLKMLKLPVSRVSERLQVTGYEVHQQADGKERLAGITADRIIYKHAIDMCQSAALEELFGNPDEVRVCLCVHHMTDL